MAESLSRNGGEAYWLIERGSPAEFWGGSEVGWTRDVSKVHPLLRFPTSAQAHGEAERIRYWPGVGGDGYRVTEHLDCGPEPLLERESVDEVLSIVESYGPWGRDINESLRFQIVLADEVKRLRSARSETEGSGKWCEYSKKFDCINEFPGDCIGDRGCLRARTDGKPYAVSATEDSDPLQAEVANITKRLLNGWQALYALGEGQDEPPHRMEVQIMREAKLLIEDLYGMVCRARSSSAPSSEVEQLHVQLAGCSTAALGWNKEPAREGDYGWSRAYQDVLELRAKYERLQTDFAARSAKGDAHG